ncbi:MAG: L,D-transpeptidase family protein, partial [Planctomycetota bacterium]
MKKIVIAIVVGVLAVAVFAYVPGPWRALWRSGPTGTGANGPGVGRHATSDGTESVDVSRDGTRAPIDTGNAGADARAKGAADRYVKARDMGFATSGGLAILEELYGEYGDTWAGGKAALELADMWYSPPGADLAKALEAYQRGYPQAEGARKEVVRRRIIELGGEVPGEPGAGHVERGLKPGEIKTHVVKGGETLWRIAQDYGATVEVLRLLNGLSDEASHTIFPGQLLKVGTGRPRIDISKSGKILTVYFGDEKIKEYKIGVGKTVKETPVGKFTMRGKTPKPAWQPIEDGVRVSYPYGHPKNPLGPMWLGLEGQGTGYGIHGVKEDGSMDWTIGKAESNGCIRMANTDVMALAAMIP